MTAIHKQAQVQKVYGDEAIAQAEKTLHQTMTQADEVCLEATAPAWRAYLEAMAKARLEATAPARLEAIVRADRAFDEATTPAWKAYRETAAQAYRALEEVTAKESSGQKEEGQ